MTRKTKQPPPNELSTALAMQVVDFVRKRDLPAGTHLTEQMIVEEFKISRSPVRKAMAFLEGLGVLKNERNRGFFLQKTGKALERIDGASAIGSADSVYLQLADDRLRGKLGEHVTEAEIMRRYDISRVQAQQLLHRTAREGLVVRRQGRGWMFLPVLDSLEAHNQSYRFRMIIEPAAMLEPTFRVDKEAFARSRREQWAMLEGDILRLPRARLFQVGAEFHEMIVGCSGNQFLLDALCRQNQLRRLIEYRASVDRSRLVKQCREHLKLLDLIEGGDRQAAATFLRRHLDVVRAIKTGIGAAKTGVPPSERVHVQL